MKLSEKEQLLRHITEAFGFRYALKIFIQEPIINCSSDANRKLWMLTFWKKNDNGKKSSLSFEYYMPDGKSTRDDAIDYFLFSSRLMPTIAGQQISSLEELKIMFDLMKM